MSLQKNVFLVVLVLLAVCLALATTAMPTYADGAVSWTGQGTTNGELNTTQCDANNTPYLLWVFTLGGGQNTVSQATLTVNGTDAYGPNTPSAGQIKFTTPFYNLGDLTANVNYVGDLGKGESNLVISHGCAPVEKLEVSKTAHTSYTRTHKWDIAKSVTPAEISLYADGHGDSAATWTVDVTYGGYDDTDHNVSGDITINNTGTLAAVINSVDDVLAGTPIAVDCGSGFPYSLAAGDTLTCTYSQAVDSQVAGQNTVTVTTEKNAYSAEAELVWGDPNPNVNATITVVDSSDLFGDVTLGTVAAPDNAQFTYDKPFAWADYGRTNCGDHTYHNTAKVIGDDNAELASASASLNVHVQCLIFKGETAWAANGNKSGELRYNQKGNWATYVQYGGAAKTTTLFAGQTINVGIVNFSAPAGVFVTITINLTAPWEFAEVAENLKVQGYATAPSGNPEPGLFAYKKTCNVTNNTCEIVVPQSSFYGVHSSVGQWIPDPNFP